MTSVGLQVTHVISFYKHLSNILQASVKGQVAVLVLVLCDAHLKHITNFGPV